MSQSGFTPIQLYRTSTAAAVPTAGNLAAGELAINLTDEALYFKNAAGVVKLLADSSGALGTVTSVDVSGGTTGLTTSGGPITSSGTITLAGTLGVANGGTGTATAFTAGSVVFAGASGVYTQDNANLFWDNTNDRLGIGTATPVTRLHVSQSNSGDYASVVLLSNSADAAADRTGIYGSPAPGTANPYRGGITFWPGSTGAVSIHTGNNATPGAGERVRIDGTNGNVGIGTSSPGEKLQVVGSIRVNTTGTIFSNIYTSPGNTQTWLVNNGSSSDTYLTSDTAQRYRMLTGVGHRWETAASGTAGAAISWTERMVLDASGNVGIGTSSPTGRFAVVGSAAGAGIFSVDTDATRVDIQSYNKPLAINRLGNNTLMNEGGGNVGIGTTAALGKLQVASAGAGASEIVASNTVGVERIHLVSRNTAGNSYIQSQNSTCLVGTYDNYSMQFLTNNTERMRIDTSGNVGIGTSSPGQKLDVSVAGGNNFAGIRSQNSNTGTGIAGIEFSSDATYSKAAIGLLRQNANGQGSLVFYNASSTGAANWSTADERMRIDSSGNLLVGTTSGTGGIAGTAPRLVVEPPNTSTHGVILKSLGQSYDVGLIWNTAASGDNKFFEFGTDATYTARGSINYNRTAGLVAYNTTSDYRAKDIIGPLQDTGATIDALKVYNGKMKGATIARPMLVAHEAQEVVPYAVTGQKDAVNEDGTDKYQQMDHQSFIPLLIAEIQSLRARVAQLEGN
jgi:hypothetical protein